MAVPARKPHPNSSHVPTALATSSAVTQAAGKSKRDPRPLTSAHDHARTAAAAAFNSHAVNSIQDDELTAFSALAPIGNSSPRGLARAKSSPHQLQKKKGLSSEGSHLARQRSSAAVRVADKTRGRKNGRATQPPPTSRHQSMGATATGSNSLLRRSRSTASSNGLGRVNAQARSLCGDFKSVASGGSVGRDDSDDEGPVVFRPSPMKQVGSAEFGMKRSASFVGVPGARRKGIPSTKLRGIENSKLPDRDAETKQGGGEKQIRSMRRRATTTGADGSPPRVLGYGSREEENLMMLRRSEPQDENMRLIVEAARDKYLRAYQEGSMAKLYEMISISRSNSPERNNDSANARMRSLNMVDEVSFPDHGYGSGGGATGSRAQYLRQMQRTDQSGHDYGYDDTEIREAVERLAEAPLSSDHDKIPQRGSLRLKMKKMSGSLRKMYGRSSGAPSIPPRSSSVVPTSSNPIGSLSSAQPVSSGAAPVGPSSRTASGPARRSTSGNSDMPVVGMGSLEFPAQQMQARRAHWFGGRGGKADRDGDGSEMSAGGTVKRMLFELSGKRHAHENGSSDERVASSSQGGSWNERESSSFHGKKEEMKPPIPPVHWYLLPRDREESEEEQRQGPSEVRVKERVVSRDTPEQDQSRITSWADSSARDGTTTALSTRTNDPSGLREASQRSNAVDDTKSAEAFTSTTHGGAQQQCHPPPPLKQGFVKRVRSVSLFSSSTAASSAGKSEGSVRQKGNKLQKKRSLLLLGKGGAGSRLSMRDDDAKGEKGTSSTGKAADSKGVYEALLRRIGGKGKRERDVGVVASAHGRAPSRSTEEASPRATSDVHQDHDNHENEQQLEHRLEREEETPTPPIPPKSTLRLVREEDDVVPADDEDEESEGGKFDERHHPPFIHAPGGFGLVSPSIYSERPAPGVGYGFGRSMSTLHLPESHGQSQSHYGRERQQMQPQSQPGMATITMSKSVSTFNLRGQEKGYEDSVAKKDKIEAEPQQRSMSEEWRDWARERTMGFSGTEHGGLRELNVEDAQTGGVRGHGVRRHKREGAAVGDEGLSVLTRTPTLMNERFPMVPSRKGSKVSMKSTASNSRQASGEKAVALAGKSRTKTTLERAVSSSVVSSPAAATRAGALRSASSGVALRSGMGLNGNTDGGRSLRSVSSAAAGLRGPGMTMAGTTNNKLKPPGDAYADTTPSNMKDIADRIISRLPSRDPSEKASDGKDTATSDGRKTPRKNAVVLKNPSLPRDGREEVEAKMSNAMSDVKREIRKEDERRAASTSAASTPAARPATGTTTTARTPENDRPSRIPSPKRPAPHGVSPVPRGENTSPVVLQKRASVAAGNSSSSSNRRTTKPLRERIEKTTPTSQSSVKSKLLADENSRPGGSGVGVDALRASRALDENSRPVGRVGGAGAGNATHEVMDDKFLGGIRRGPYAVSSEGATATVSKGSLGLASGQQQKEDHDEGDDRQVEGIESGIENVKQKRKRYGMLTPKPLVVRESLAGSPVGSPIVKGYSYGDDAGGDGESEGGYGSGYGSGTGGGAFI
ncbi:MAG: hypothetical protein M1831_000055 [Alyxoria varia]|nr:MAG: hypothetical protein M1831_000055 [Alyxoria varia]